MPVTEIGLLIRRTSPAIRLLLLQRRQIGHQRVDVLLGQRVRSHLRLARRVRLRGHALRVDDPRADVVRGERAADLVQRSFRVALPRNRMAEGAFLIGEDLLALSFRILRHGRACESCAQGQYAYTRSNHGSSLSCPHRCTTTAKRNGIKLFFAPVTLGHYAARTSKSVRAAGGRTMRKALRTASRSMTSCATAPATGVRRPAEASAIPSPLSSIPPTALSSATRRNRRLMCSNSST